MRLALQATFDDLDGTTDESRRRRARCERELEKNRRSCAFYRKLSSVVDDPNVKAPEVFAQESFPDPNVVAEYLDYRSESEEIASEYERVCWDSPEALAEVGDCYDILVNDLPKQIIASKNCRRRLYYVAWEESAQASQNEETSPKSDRSLLESDEISPCSTDSEPKGKTSTLAPSPAEDESCRSKAFTKSSASPRQESDVQRAMRKERSVKRRLRAYALNAIVLSCVFSVGIWAWSKTQNDHNSETFQLATDQKSKTEIRKNSDAVDSFTSESKIADANHFDERARTEENGKQDHVVKVADSRLGNHSESEPNADCDDAQDWGKAPNPFDESDGDVLKITHVDGAPSDVEFPSVPATSSLDDYKFEASASSEAFEKSSARSSEQKRVRVGLDGAHRRSVEIPQQNNDVFAPTRLY